MCFKVFENSTISIVENPTKSLVINDLSISFFKSINDFKLPNERQNTIDEDSYGEDSIPKLKIDDVAS